MIRRHKISRNRLSSRFGARKRVLLTEQLENRTLLAANVLQNPVDAVDVNDDGFRTPLDALVIINELNIAGARSLRTGTPPTQGALFYDVNGDEFVTPIDALMVLNELNAEGEDDDLVQIRLQVVDTEDNAIDTIDIDQDFVLQAYVTDLTGRDNGGVFAAFADVLYTDALVSVSGDLIHNNPPYGNAPSGNTTGPGLIDEAGSIDGLSPLGPAEQLLFSIQMTANANGLATFEPEPADILPAHQVLVFGEPEGEGSSSIIPQDRIAFVSASLEIGTIDFPIARDDMYDAIANEQRIVSAENGVLSNDEDPLGGTLIATIEDDVTDGVVELNSDGSFTYTPNQDFTGTDSFTYVASNVGATSNIATVEITVAAVNRPPVAVNDDYETDEDVPLDEIEGVLINDSDPDGDPLTARVVTEPLDGTLNLRPDGTFVYEPSVDFHGTDSFTYVANDGEFDSNVATATIVVREVNDRPIANPDFYTAQVNALLQVPEQDGVLANDSDDGDLTAILVTDVSHGQLQLFENGSFEYTPDVDYTGEDTFTYVANDGELSSDETLVTITVTASGPLVDFRLETTNLAGEPITSIAPNGAFVLDVYMQDIRQGAPQDGVFAAYMDVLYNSATVNGSIEFNPIYDNQRSGSTTTPGLVDEVGAFDGISPVGSGEFLLFSLPFIADSQEGVINFESEPADNLPSNNVLLYNLGSAVPEDQIIYGSVDLQIVAGDPPIAVDDEYETFEDIELIVSAADGVLKNDVDPDGDALTAQLVNSTLNGSLTLRLDGSFDYLPDPNFFGVDIFTYQASDGANLSNVASVRIDVLPLNDAPIAVDDFYSSDGEQLIIAAPGVLDNDIEVEGETMTANLVDDASHGDLDLSPDGSFVYTPDPDFIGRDTFTYQAEAGDQLSNIATVNIDVGDLSESSIRGFVYFDTNNDGHMDSQENRVGDVELTLRGVDLLGNEVFEQTKTAGDGSYEFDSVLRGQYVLTEFQPMYLIDGMDTIDGDKSLRNDRFIIDLPAGVDMGDYNFGERGLEPHFINNTFFFASRQMEGLLAMVDEAGQSRWYSSDDRWQYFDPIRVELSSNLSTAVIRATEPSGFIQSSDVRILGNHDVTLSKGGHGYIIRFKGEPEDFGLAAGPLGADAVDAAFGGDDA